MQQFSNEEPSPVQAAPQPEAVEAALITNQQAFLHLLAQYVGQEGAQDVLQQFALRALSKAATLKKQESVVAWLYRVLHTTLMDHLRRESRRQRQEILYRRHQEGAITDAALKEHICTCLSTFLPTLPPDYADILRRIDLHGEPRQQVGRELGLSVNNVTVRLHRARQALKNMLLLSCQTCPHHGFQRCACDLPQQATHRDEINSTM